MEGIYVPIVVALIGGPVMWFLAMFDKRNTEQHGENMKILSRVEGKMDRMDGKVDRLDEKVDRIDGRVTSLEKPATKVRNSKKSV
jgi:hypothetical protein